MHLVATAASPVSRADIAGVTGLTRATASSLVDALLDGGLLQEVGPAQRAGGGRRATGLALATNGLAGLGLEINVDYVAACVLDLTGAVRHREVDLGDVRGLSPAEAIARVSRLARTACRVAVKSGLTLAGAALVVPGLVTAPDGPRPLAPTLGSRAVDSLRVLRSHPTMKALGEVAVTVDNEANAAALEERAATVEESFVLVSGEIGIGAGIVIEGALLRGQHGWAGELGHLPVRPDGPACPCGGRGCLEEYAGLEALLRAVGGPPPTGTGLGGAPAAAHIASRAAGGDKPTLRALTRAGEALGVALASTLNLLDVQVVVLGGVYRELHPWIAPAVERELARRVLWAPWAAPVVRPARVGADAAVRGAARSVVRAVLDDPARRLH